MGNYIEKIRGILDKAGWPQSRLAEEIGVTFATVNRWLNGHTKPHPGQLRQIDVLFKRIVGVSPLEQSRIREAMQGVESERRKFKNIKDLIRQKEIMEEFLLELTYNSDAIEGSTLTKKETEAIIFDKATIKDRSLIEHLEAVNHASILRDIFEGKFNHEITEGLIKEIHKILMRGIREDGGEYAKHHRGIRGVDLILPSPEDISEEMRLFCEKVNDCKGYHLEHIAKMHADFEAIHPFGDGNGRVGRLIMIIQLVNADFAPCVISVDHKAEYYEFLEYAQKRTVTHFVYFLAEAVLRGYQIVKKYGN